MTNGKFLIYGANGYTGELIAREAARRGLRPILGGRSQNKVEPLARELGLICRTFSLEDRKSREYTLKEIDFVLNCAGPFQITARPLIDSCLRLGKHYLDITGEIGVFEAAARGDEEARKSDAMILCGVGFDVVPSDCLARHLKNRLPDAQKLSLAFMGLGGISRGTKVTMLENAGSGGAIRENGEIKQVPAAFRTRKFDFSDKLRQIPAVTIPWGDVSTAFYSTGIPNIEVYTAMPKNMRRSLALTNYFGWFLRRNFVKRCLQSKIPHGGPDEQTRKTARSYLYGEAVNADGSKVCARLDCPEAYQTTVMTALNICEKVLRGNWQKGFQTPAKIYGADLILEIESTCREDI